MTVFWDYFQIGMYYILDRLAYNYVLFLTALIVPYTFKDWRRILFLFSFFTLGYVLTLLFSTYQIVVVKSTTVYFLIPITILIVALFNLFTLGKPYRKGGVDVLFFSAFFFGTIYGLSFSNYFKTIFKAGGNSKLIALFEFGLGIGTAQIILFFAILMLSYTIQDFFKFSKRDWILIVSSLIIGLILPMI